MMDIVRRKPSSITRRNSPEDCDYNYFHHILHTTVATGLPLYKTCRHVFQYSMIKKALFFYPQDFVHFVTAPVKWKFMYIL